jgi:hypothetical protein
MFKIAKFLVLFFLIFDFANATKGPQYRSLRVHGMGGAFIAVADGREALYYNPAGLNLKSRYENFEKYPEMGYMPRQRYEFRLLTASVGLPANEIGDIIDICGAPKIGTIIKKLIFLNFGYFKNITDWCPQYTDVFKNDGGTLDSLKDNPHLIDSLIRLDYSPIEIGAQVSILEFSMHNFGFATWVNANAAPRLELGQADLPGFSVEPVQIDAAIQTGAAFSPVDNWSVGVGLKAARRHKEIGFKYDPTIDLSGDDPSIKDSDKLDSLQRFWEHYLGDSLAQFKFKDINFALDFGALYQITREVRLGTSLRNVFFGKFAGETITPNLSIGAAYSPMLFQSNSWWARKVHFAADYVDIADGTVGDMFLAHLNFGAEIEQVVLPSPSRDLSFWPRLGIGVLGGLLGFGVGYVIDYGIPGLAIGSLAGLNVGFGGDVLRTSVGAGIESYYLAWNIALGLSDAVTARFGSYAEERGVKTGQKEQRFWTGELSVGF